MSRLGKILYIFATVSLFSFLLLMFMLRTWVPFMWIALAMFAGSLVAAFYVDKDFYKEFLGMRTTKQGMSMGVMIGLVLVLMAAINFVGARRYATFDFSLAKVNTLSDQSVKLLGSLKGDLNVLYFYKNGTEGVEQNRRMFIDLIKKYQDQSPKVKLQFVEVNERPDLAEKYKVVKGTQAVLLDYEGRTNLIEKIDEQELTSALVKVTRETDKKIYILSGHRELAVEPSQDGNSISFLKALLEGNRYTVMTFSLTTVGAIPDDADVVIIPGPQQSYLDAEVEAIENYLKRGGSLILALRGKATSGFGPLLNKLGVEPMGNLIATVLETPMGRAVDPRFTRGSEFSTQSQITAPFGRSEFTVFRLPQGLKKGKVPDGVSFDEIVKTNQSVLGFKDMDFQSSAGEKGPFTLGIELKGKFPGVTDPKPFSMLVFGDADFLNDQYLYQNLNRDLFLNSVASLAKEENLISITPKEVTATKMELPEMKFGVYILIFIIGLPLSLFALSGVVWFRRRHA